MQRRSLNACADYETKILPTFLPSCQTLLQSFLATNRQLRRNFLIVTTTSIFNSALECDPSKGCRLSRIFARKMECFQSGPASLASCKKRRAIERLFCDRCCKLTCLVGQTEVEI